MPKSQKHRALQKGEWAELIVCFWLFCLGYRIIARRLRSPVAEIDIIARHRFKYRNTLVIVEVKYRRKIIDAMLALRPKQKARLYRAGSWLQSSGYIKPNDSIRWDFVALGNWSWPYYARNIFQ